MRKNLTQMFLLLSIALFSTLFAGCNTEEVDPVVPSLEISQEAGGEAVSSLTLAFGSAEATQSFAIRCNRNWTAVSSNDEWVVVSPESGEGDATVNVSVTRNPGTKRTATITVSTILYKKTVTIEQAGEQAEAQVIYFDNLDGEEASNASGNWPFADTFEGFNKQGTGVAEVTYKSSSVTVRANSVSNDTKYNTSDYSANIASGVNNLYFQAGATFEVHKIALDGLDKLQLTLGVERNEYGNYDAPFNPEEFIVSLSADGNSWVELPYTRSTYKGWDMATADFQLKEAPEYLYIKMAASVATRVDDIKLTTGVGGTEIDLAAGETPDEPGVDGTLLYYESFDGTTLSGNTSLDNFEEAGGFVRQGLGGAAVSYAGTTFDFRKTSASSGYDGVSGVNNAFGNSDGKVLYANNINVGNAQNLDLSFGLSAYSSWEPANFIVSYTTDGGTTWNDLTLTRESAKGWKLTTASFTVAEADAVIGLRFFVKVANSQQYRVDDITLTTADEGVQIEAIPTVNTEDAEEVTMHGAKLSGSYEFDGTLSEAGIAYKAASAEDYTYVQAMALASPFSITLNTLEAGTTYEYFAYVKADGKEYRGDVKSFSTEKDQSQTVTYFADDFADVVNNMHYESGKWTLVSSDPDYAGNCYMGWYGKIYNGVDYYIQCAPYNSSLSEVVAYAVMTKFNVAEAVGKKLTFDLAWYYQKASDGSKLEIVASKDFNGDVDAATWEVVKNISYTDQKTNEWISHEIDLSAEYGQEKALAVAFRYTGKGDTYRLDNVEFGAADTSDKLAVTTGEATEVTASEAVLSGSYKGGTEAPAEVGVEYRLYGAADYTKKAADKVAESFEVKVDNLVADTRYEFRAYAVSGTETVYGEAVTFNTLNDTPDEITPIADVNKGNTYTMSGTVTALSARGFILTDDSGSILYYDQNGTDYEIGQKLTVKGEIDSYNKGLQIVGSSAQVTVDGKGDYTYPTPATADAAAIDAYVADQEDRLATYVSLTGTMSVSGTYYNVIVDGTNNQGSVYYPTDEIKAKIKDGETVTIEGYATAVSGGRYYNIVAVDVKTAGGGDTPVASPIADVQKGNTYTMSGTVTALSSRGFILTDDSGSILYYDQNGTDYEIGQQLTVEGEIDSYNKGLQIVGSSAKVTVNGKVDYTYPTPAAADAAAIDAYVADQTDRLATYVSLKGTMSVSGTFYNVIVDGTSNQGSIYYPTDEIKAKIKNGETVTIEGYATSVSGGRYYNVIAVDVKTEGGGDTPTSTPIADVENGNTYTMEGVVTALTSNGFVLTDNSGSIFFYGKKNYEIGQQLTVEGKISVYNKGLQINGQSATITEGSKITYQYPTPTVVDAAAVDAFIADQSNRLATYVSVTGDASVSGNYYNLIIDGTSNQGSFYSPTDEIKAKIQDGMNITVVGYALSVSGGRFYNIIAVDVTVNGAGAPSIEVADEEMSFVAAGETLTTEVTTSNQGSYGIFAKTSDPHFTASVSGTTLSVTAAANTGAAKSATVTVYLAESEGGEAVASADVACTQLASGAVVAYTTGFEASEGFKAGTNYQNADPVYQGAEGSQWGVVFGTSSTTKAITGDQSMQMRWYTSAPDTFGYAFTNFNIKNANKVEFQAKYSGNAINLTVSYSTDNGATWVGAKDFVLKTSAQSYEYVIGETPVENVRLKFQIKLTETTPTKRCDLIIDDVTVYGAE